MGDTQQPTFADMIRQARIQRNLTQAALAHRARVSLRLVARWEAGETVCPQPAQLGAVCSVLDLSRPRALHALGYLTDGDLAEVA